jgi:hypothetical protein
MGPVLSLRPEPVGEESTHAAFQTIPLLVQKFDLDRRKVSLSPVQLRPPALLLSSCTFLSSHATLSTITHIYEVRFH